MRVPFSVMSYTITMNIKESILKFISSAKEIWESLPKEVRVSAFIAVSYGISELAKQLGLVQTDNQFLVFGINIVLVFLKELGSRITILREKLSK